MGVLAALAATALVALPAPTSDRIRVFSDQLPDGLAPALVQFAATHYAGAQKLGASETLALKRINPQFFMIQYRLGLGLGRTTQIRFGDSWVPEWPEHPQPQWFYLWHGRRVHQAWGWYLMNPDNPSWRAYWVAQVRRQVATTHADGVFMDSTSVPNDFGASTYSPQLPAYDPPWEIQWSHKIERWLPYAEKHVGKPIIVNAGSWVTTRERTDYSGAAGIMVEGFATNLAPADWQLELTRALGLIRKGKVVICQSYPDVGDVQARMFDLASYLLIKGGHTYVNFGEGIQVSWFPEYAIDLGVPVDPPALRQDQGAFVRRYANGLVLANPSDAAVHYVLPGTMQLVTPSGGGAVPASGQIPASWTLHEAPVTSVTLGPRQGAVLLH
ncbi:MAG TPA: putative glycoside hydrolase [Gaiellaceae bacterium]|nr:putative glycoside hydrolase [Gaiellaceae bacterium]